LVGNPNVGKTSLFNVLTDSRYMVGNYAGVTVETRAGALRADLATIATGEGRAITVLDLPGIYSLTPMSEDEAVAARCLDGQDGARGPDAVILVVDAANLGRNLYLAMQLIEREMPLVIALNMIDVAREAGLQIELEALERALGVVVVPTIARVGEGAAALVSAVASLERSAASSRASGLRARLLAPTEHGLDACAVGGPSPSSSSSSMRAAIPELGAVVDDPCRCRWLLSARAAGTEDLTGAGSVESAALSRVRVEQAAAVTRELVERRYREVDEILATLGYSAGLADDGVAAPAMDRSQRIDRLLTHRVWGLVVFVVVMALLFSSIFSWAAPLMDVIEGAIAWASGATRAALGPGLFTDLVTEGVIAGVGNVLVFIPQIALLFLFIGLLEDTGYMARAAFLIDRLMARVGLHGRAFVPLLSGYACAIPAIMGARTIRSFKDRLVTILMIPYMSCSARLPIYVLIIGALFPGDRSYGPFSLGGLVLLGMYALSTVSALAIGALYKRTLLRSPTPPLVLELPPYRLPRLRNTLLFVYDRTADFVRGAGTVILAVTVVLWALLSFPKPPAPSPAGVADAAAVVQRHHEGARQPGVNASPLEHSIGGRIGKALEPALLPMGQDYRVGIAILASFAAREVMVSTLGLVYGIEGADDDDTGLRQAMREAKDDDGEPRHTPLRGLALMVFFVYACQCMSTIAVVRRETGGWTWPAFMFFSMTALAYAAAVLVFQIGRLLGYS
jgi:ferrous iron transport protein B